MGYKMRMEFHQLYRISNNQTLINIYANRLIFFFQFNTYFMLDIKCLFIMNLNALFLLYVTHDWTANVFLSFQMANGLKSKQKTITKKILIAFVACCVYISTFYWYHLDCIFMCIKWVILSDILVFPTFLICN